jgi:hypothetical protein
LELESRAPRNRSLIIGKNGPAPPAAKVGRIRFNCHRDHFSTTWDLRSEDGELVHTACVAFGIDRLALALFAAHGPDLANWPNRVRQNLAL